MTKKEILKYTKDILIHKSLPYFENHQDYQICFCKIRSEITAASLVKHIFYDDDHNYNGGYFYYFHGFKKTKKYSPYFMVLVDTTHLNCFFKALKRIDKPNRK
jgi:hypothetical protein